MISSLVDLLRRMKMGRGEQISQRTMPMPLPKWPLTPVVISPEEKLRRELAAQLSKERCSHIPFYKRAEAQMGEKFWLLFSKSFPRKR